MNEEEYRASMASISAKIFSVISALTLCFDSTMSQDIRIEILHKAVKTLTAINEECLTGIANNR